MEESTNSSLNETTILESQDLSHSVKVNKTFKMKTYSFDHWGNFEDTLIWRDDFIEFDKSLIKEGFVDLGSKYGRIDFTRVNERNFRLKVLDKSRSSNRFKRGYGTNFDNSVLNCSVNDLKTAIELIANRIFRASFAEQIFDKQIAKVQYGSREIHFPEYKNDDDFYAFVEAGFISSNITIYTKDGKEIPSRNLRNYGGHPFLSYAKNQYPMNVTLTITEEYVEEEFSQPVPFGNPSENRSFTVSNLDRVTFYVRGRAVMTVKKNDIEQVANLIRNM